MSTKVDILALKVLSERFRRLDARKYDLDRKRLSLTDELQRLDVELDCHDSILKDARCELCIAMANANLKAFTYEHNVVVLLGHNKVAFVEGLHNLDTE